MGEIGGGDRSRQIQRTCERCPECCLVLIAYASGGVLVLFTELGTLEEVAVWVGRDVTGIALGPGEFGNVSVFQ